MKVNAKNPKRNFFIPNIVYVLIFAFLLRVFLSFFGTLHLDQGTFVGWSTKLATSGFKSFYDSWSDYLPGYLYVLWGLGKINLLQLLPTVVLYKLPAIISDVLTGYLIYKIIKDAKILKTGIKKEWMAITGSLIFLLNPAVFANSSLWGQVDSLTSLFTILSVYTFPFSIFWSSISLAIGTLIKPQAAFIFPVIVLLFIQQKRKVTDFLIYSLIGLAIFFLAFIPFSNGNLFQFIINRLNFSANQYPFTSVNAFNFWGLFGFWKPDGILYQFGGYIAVVAAGAILFIKSIKNKLQPYYLMSFIFTASFMFFTRMHERHLLPVFAPLAVISLENPIFIIPYISYSLIYAANLLYSYLWIEKDFIQVFPDFMIKILCVFGIAFSFYIFYLIFKNKKENISKMIFSLKTLMLKIRMEMKIKNKLPKINLGKKESKVILVLILGFAFLTRVINLGNPKEMYFDEVYHAFTAKTMLGTDFKKAWEWWNTPPEGFAYEWTHPPLAKLGMALGMVIFGQNPFGYRVPGALLGAGSVFLIYLIAKNLIKDEAMGLLSAGVFSLDGLPLVLNRIGMNDSYLLFFSLLSIYFFIKEKDLLSAIAYGFAISSKWSALWAVPIIFLLWLKRKNKFKASILWFLVFPILIYLLSYLPMFTTGHDFSVWWGMQKQMWWYHTGLKATHPYTSSWWSWPFMIRPVYLYTSNEIGGFVSRIYAIGNPAVFWFGIFSIFICAFYSFYEKNKTLGLVVFSYLIFFVPWAASPRIMFLYHYLPSIPFMSIAIAYVLRRNKKLVYQVLPIFLLLFIYFYPHWAGLRIPLWLDRSYYWLSSWR